MTQLTQLKWEFFHDPPADIDALEGYGRIVLAQIELKLTPEIAFIV